MVQKNQKAFSKQIFHIFFVALFCGGFFYAGQQVYPFLEFYFSQNNSEKIVEIINNEVTADSVGENVPPLTLGSLDGFQLGNQDGWNIFIRDIQLSYNETSRKIVGTYIVENFDEKSLDGIYLQFLLTIPRSQSNYPPMYFDSQITDVFSIPGKTELKKEFSYTVREGLAGKGASVLMEAHMSGGDLITFVQSPIFDIPGNLRILSLKKPHIVDSNTGEEYLIGEGPTLYPESGKFRLAYSLVHEGTEDITVTPTFEVYKLIDKNDSKIASIPGAPLKVVKGESPLQYMDIPTMDFVPGIYVGKLLLVDEKGINLGIDAPVRWIVGGDIARIINVVNYHPYGFWGSVTLDLEYTGTPPSINKTPQALEAPTKDARVFFTFQKKNGTPLGETHSGTIPLYIGQKIGTQQFTFPVGKYSTNPFLKVVIKGEKETILDEKVFSLNNSLVTQPSNNNFLYGILLFLGFLALLLYFYFRKRRAHTLLTLIVVTSAVGFLSYVPPADAYVANCELADVNISGPSPSTVFACGQTYAFTGGWWMNACMNTDADMYVAGNLVYHNEGLGCVSAGCEYNVRRNGTFSVNRTLPGNYRGGYVVRIGWSKSQGDCSNSGTANYGINITCCAGAVPQNAVKCPNTEANINNQPVLNCSGARACEYDCIAGYVPDTPNSIHCRLPVCLANGGVGANANNVGPANSYPLSGAELPGGLQLTQDYYTTLRWSIGATQYTVAEVDRTGTGAGCEYTCNAGYIPDGASSCRLPVCLPNSAIGVTANNVYPGNASPISATELPSSLTLVRDYTSTLITDPNRRTELNTAAGCEYTCNDGFKIGPKTATAESNTAGTFAKITHGGGGYTTAPSVQVTGGSCTTRPTAVATINASGSLDSLTLTGAVNCTVAPTLTISAPTDTTSRCIATQCIGFAKPDNATYCSGDTTLAGHDDEINTRRADSSGCTSNAKCEWYCPAATPFYCESANTCVTSQNECGQTNTCKTSAPSEIKKELDIPFIQCDAINTTDSHFRYKITKTGGTASDTYISPLFTVGTSVKHPTTFYSGTYTVTCLYGTAANTNATLPDYGMTAGTCTKTMTANDTANGCSRIYPYRGSTLSDELSSASAFDASFRCGSREVVTNTTDTRAYRLQVATSDPSFLAYDRNITDLFAGLAIGPVSTQTQNYNFNTGADITCAAKVGDGYSTNPSCQARACVGGACATPQSFIVVPSEEVTCTNQDSISYDVGCNPASPDYTECLQWMYQDNANTTNVNGVTTYNRNAKIKVNNIEQDIYFTCKIETPPGALGPVKTCSIQLPSGGTPVTIFAGDATTQNNTTNYSFQTTAYTLRKDTGKPTGTITYYTNYSNGVTLSPDQYEYWQKQPITAVITCTDKAATSATGEPTTAGETDGSGCACSQTLTHTSNSPTPTAAEQTEIDQWSLGIPSSNTNIGPDVMTYSRVIANMNNATTTAPAVKVQDSANNKSTQSFQPDFGIDSTAPKLVATKTGNSVTLAFTDNHVGASGFWKPLSAFNEVLPAGVSRGTTPNNSAILYRIGPKTNLAALEFGADCSPLPVKNTNYYKYKEVPAAPGTQTLTLSSFDVNNNIVAYCIQDNAGNINRGYYPNNLMGCFASTAMPTVPTLSPSTLASHYAPLLKTKFASATLSNNEKYGYSFSESPTNASCFRGILSNNITTLVTNQLNPRPAGEVTLSNWTTKLSTIKNTTTPNTNGYYYYTFSANTNNTVTVTPPTGTGTKNVIVDGGNIQINSNIEYTGSGKTLLLIARKNNAGQGGNIYINPTVTRIDAIIIADGGTLMNGVTSGGSTDIKEWTTPDDVTLLTNRLTINGRLYSYNTRGGSITPQTSGTDFDPITTNIGKYFDTNSTNATQLITTATPTQAAAYDLERLRVMLSDGNSQCTTQVNYQAFTVANLPALLTRPVSYQGGNCSF